jgi:hypothetical protein
MCDNKNLALLKLNPTAGLIRIDINFHRHQLQKRCWPFASRSLIVWIIRFTCSP